MMRVSRRLSKDDSLGSPLLNAHCTGHHVMAMMGRWACYKLAAQNASYHRNMKVGEGISEGEM